MKQSQFLITISKKATKDLENIPAVEKTRIATKINDILSVNPFSNGINPKKLKGMPSFRLRIGNYRIVYEIIDNKVFIYAIAHRKDVYKF